ncbi:MAG: hypothetical protein JOZ78_21775 [Chroococcidiopsidaceae cyanobacterium CP_BM_ER_R8_30]|nr:hypothetical protein [Chroococcidiopsidaceae cyanobacterium CP_BM_ER_R8_30]
MLQTQVSFLPLVAAATAAFGTILGLSSAPALADSFNFSYSVSGITASGVFITNPYDPSTNSYLITSIDGGQRDGNPITLLPPGALGAAGNDNLLIANPSLLDERGFSYSAGGIEYNVFSITPGGPFEESSQNFTAIPLTSFAVTPPPTPPSTTLVPEPSEEMAVVVMGVWIARVWGLRKKNAVLSQHA